MTKYSKLIILVLIILGLNACKDDPIIPNDGELITTLIFTLTPDTGAAVTLTFQDLDGDGGNAPNITNGTLAANTNYTGSLQLLNETENPAEDITLEIADEDEDHQFFFSASSGLNLTTAYADMDSLGNPIGLMTTLGAGAASTGQYNIILRHEPDKSATGVSSGDITNAGGDTDIEVTFDITIQ